MDYHVAQVNIGRIKVPFDSPEAAEFAEALDPINEVADADPEFVWRLQTKDGNATSVRIFDSPYLMVNLSVWTSVEALSDYTYRSDHATIMRKRRQWFEPLEEPNLALWWVPAGHIPTLDEAEEKLTQLWDSGPSSEVFTFAAQFPPPAQ